LSAASLLFCGGEFVSGGLGTCSRTARRMNGGAMGNDEKEQEDESESGQSSSRRDLGVGEVLDPENGLTNVVAMLHNEAARVLAKNLTLVVDCILDNVKKGNLSSAKLLMELAGQAQSEKGVSEVEYRSFAEELWKEYRKSVGEVAD